MMLDLLGFAAAYAGWTALFLATDRHHRDIFGTVTPPRRRVRLRRGGAVLLGLSAWSCLAAHGAIGCVQWSFVLAMTALAVTATGTWMPRATGALGVAAVILTALASAGALLLPADWR